MNKVLLRQGQIAFFVDEVLGLLALPCKAFGKLDVYSRPIAIQVYGQNGYTRIIKNPEDYVIMYDNNGRYPLYLDIIQYAERLALDARVEDINLSQQKTPRFWKVATNKEQTIRDLVNNVDAYNETVIAYDSLDLNDIDLVLSPAPYVTDKVEEHKEKIWNEFLRLIGVANMNFQKKERNIKDEVLASQGGTIASRFSRFEPRKKAVDEINEKFSSYLSGKEIEVSYYDGIPTSQKELMTDAEDEDFINLDGEETKEDEL